jgi:hypothetical protein
VVVRFWLCVRRKKKEGCRGACYRTWQEKEGTSFPVVRV